MSHVNTPAVGQPVLVVLVDRAGIAEVIRALVTQDGGMSFLTKPHFKWHAIDDEAAWTGDGVAETADEGTTWARGWDTEMAGALLATWALRDQPQDNWGPRGVQS